VAKDEGDMEMNANSKPHNPYSLPNTVMVLKAIKVRGMEQQH
jgi:hypothetical protein